MLSSSTKRGLKKFFLYLLAALSVAFGMIFVYSYSFDSLGTFNNKIRDYMFLLRGQEKASKDIVIVDIDEKSLSSLGQWPWSRNKVAVILNHLTQSGASVIGMDVVFSEEDNSSPHRIAQQFDIQGEDLPNYDLMLAQALANSPTILGYQFQLEDEAFINKEPPTTSVVFSERNATEGEEYAINAYGTVLNIPLLEEHAYSSGFFNNVPDPSGVVRRIPLVIRYDNQAFPSLVLEIVRSYIGTKYVFLNYNEEGIESLSLDNFYIPTDRYGRFMVNFRGAEKSFKYISAVDIYDNRFDPTAIEGKIVLIGTSAAGLLDLRATPFEDVFPGVEVHANALDNILNQNFIVLPSWIKDLDALNILICSLIVVFLLTYLPFWLTPFIIVGCLLLQFYLGYTGLFTLGIIMNTVFPFLTIVLAAMVTLLMNYFFGIRQEKAIKNKFASKVSKEVMESLLDNIDQTGFDAMDKEITVMFSDVRNFTRISESMPSARDLIEFLNQYMTPMTDIIIQQHGTIDKYIGDAIMAYWNAPGDVSHHQDRALRATIEQIEYLQPLNESLEKQGLPLIDIGIGLNTGIATVGEMGSEQRSDYTCIGDPVNLGARLESLCKSYGARIIISEFVKKGLKKTYQIRHLDLVTVKGQSKPVEIFEVYGFGEPQGRLKEELELFNHAVDLYRKAEFKSALEIFRQVNQWKDKHNTKIYDTYIQRCEHYIQTPPVDFNGVFVHTTKG